MYFRIVTICILLALGLAKTGEVYYMNSTFIRGDENVTNFSLDQRAGHYHNVTDNGQGKVNVKTFTKKGGKFPGAKTQWINVHSFELLDNKCFEFLLTISFSLDWGIQVLNSHEFISMFVNFRDSQGNRTVLVIFSMSWPIMLTGKAVSIPVINSQKMEIVKFSEGKSTHLDQVWLLMEGITVNKGKSYNVEFDIMALLRQVESQFYLNGSFFLTFLNPRIETDLLVFEADLNVSKTLSQTACCQLSTINIKNLSISSQVFENVMKPNYCKIVFGGSELSQLQFAFNFQNTSYSLKSYQFVAFGYLNKQWVTPIGAYQLPLPLKNKADIMVNLSFNYQEIVMSKTTVCFTIILRRDYNVINKTFSLNSTQPSAEIIVCPWWRTDLPNAKRIRNIRVDDNQFYAMYLTSSSWPIFTFISIFPVQKSVKSFNLFKFVDKVLIYNSKLSNHHITCIQVGFRTYQGMGVFSIQELALEIKVNVTSQAPALAQCLIFQEDSTKPQKQSCSVGAIIFTSINSIMATPNFRLVLRMACSLLLIDDFTYFAYHKNIYDRRFRDLSLLAWNLTFSKWMVPQLNQVYEKINFTYKQSLSPDPTFLVPNSYVELGEDANLLRQTQQFWIGSLPFIIIVFVMIRFVYLLLSRFKRTKKIASLFKRFSWFGFLFTTIIGDNIQYFSFRCFSQLYQLMPLGSNQTLTIIISYLILFLVVFFASSSYLILPIFLPKNSVFLIEGYKSLFKTATYLISLSLLKMVSGYVHSALYKDNLHQISYILAIQVLIFTLLIKNYSIYHFKSIFACTMIQNIFRVLLAIMLCLEQNFSEFLYENPQVFEETTETIVEVLLILCVIDIILTNTLSEQKNLKSMKENHNNKSVLKLKDMDTEQQQTKKIGRAVRNKLKLKIKTGKSIIKSTTKQRNPQKLTKQYMTVKHIKAQDVKKSKNLIREKKKIHKAVSIPKASV